MNFGIIYYVVDNNVIVVMEGKEKELLSIIDVIKENINKDASIKLLEEEEYEEVKKDIRELNKLVLGE